MTKKKYTSLPSGQVYHSSHHYEQDNQIYKVYTNQLVTGPYLFWSFALDESRWWPVNKIQRGRECFSPKLFRLISTDTQTTCFFEKCLVHPLCNTIRLRISWCGVMARDAFIFTEFLELNRSILVTIVKPQLSDTSP